MKKLLFISLLLLANHTFAQTYEESRRPWSEGKLRLDEFLGHKNRHDTTQVSLYWKIQSSLETKKVRFGKIEYPITTLSMDKYRSWIDPAHRNEQTLRVCQIEFDLIEAYRRRALIDLYNSPTSDFYSVCHYYNGIFDDRYGDIYEATNYGNDIIAMSRLETEADSLLALPELDPTQVPIGEPRFRFDFILGFNMQRCTNDVYTKAPLGAIFGMNWGVRRSNFGLEFNGQFGANSKNNYSTEYGYIREGQDLNIMNYLFYYAHRVSEKNGRAFYPQVLLGVTSATRTKEEDEKQAPSLDGFTLGLGCIYEIPFYHKTTLANSVVGNASLCKGGQEYFSALQSGFSLLIRPNISFTNMDGNDGWYPAFNLSFILSWHGIYRSRAVR